MKKVLHKLTFHEGYTIGYDENLLPIWIRCRTCGKQSWNLNDIKNKYCGHCNKFHEESK